jgi:hypothetical protein
MMTIHTATLLRITMANTEIVDGFYGALGRGDMPGALGLLSPEVSWTEAAGFPYGGTYHGPDQILNNVFMKLGTEWDGFTCVPHEFIAERDKVVVLGQYSGTYKATGKKFTAPFVHVFTVTNGKLAAFHQHTDTALVQKALG